MKNRSVIHEAQQVSNLLADPTYVQVMAGVLERQALVMKAPTSTAEELTEAHAIVRALNEIDNYCRGVLSKAVVEDRKSD